MTDRDIEAELADARALVERLEEELEGDGDVAQPMMPPARLPLSLLDLRDNPEWQALQAERRKRENKEFACEDLYEALCALRDARWRADAALIEMAQAAITLAEEGWESQSARAEDA